MIKHELAKELKEAGYSQETGYGYFYTEDGQKISGQYDEVIEYTGFTYIPTLAELVDACGEKFLFFSRHPDYIQKLDNPKKPRYAARGEVVPKSKHIYVLGDTPEEAVAHLWIALQDKK